MSYRDDVDTLYTRAMILQRELDRATQLLEEREAELAQLRGPSFSPAETSPGLRALRTLPDPDDVLARLVDTADQTPAPAVRARVPELPELPPGATVMSRSKVLERVRDRLGALDEEALVVIGTLVEELSDEEPLENERLLDELRAMAERISQSYWRRR